MAQIELIIRLLPDEETTEESPPSSPQKKKGCRGCLVRLGVLGVIAFLLLTGVVLWFSGPGFRWVAQKYGPDILAAQGFQGDFEVSGSLFSGPRIDSIDLTSDTSPLKKLSARNLKLSYRPLALKDLKIDGLTADSLTIDLDLSQSAPKEKEKEEKPPSENSLADLLAKYRPVATHPEIQIDELNLHVHKSEQNFYRLQEASLTHPSQSDTFRFSPGTVTDFEDQIFQPPEAEIVWNEEDFAFARLPLAKEFSVPALKLQVEPLQLEGRVAAYGSELSINTDLSSQATATLGTQDLDLAPFLSLSPATEGTAGKLSELKAQASKLDQDFSQWEIDLSLKVKEGQYQQRALPETVLTLNKKALELDTTLRFELPEQPQVLTLLTEFAPESPRTPATAWRNSTSDLTTELASLASFLTGIAPSLNLPVPPDGWPDGEALLLARIKLEDAQPVDSRASLTFNKLNWAEAQFEKGELTVDYVDAESDLKASLIIEQSATSKLTSRASFHPQTQAYAATFAAQTFQAESLQPFIRLSIGDLPLAGKITLDWQGSGALPDLKSHRGTLVLEQTRLSIKKQTPIQLALSAQYEGIDQVKITQLSVEQDDQRLATEASWNGQRVEIPRISLVKGSQELVTGRVSAPFSLDLDLKNYFSLGEPWSVELNADRLDIPETSDLFGFLLPEGINGAVTLDLSVSGTPAQPSLAGKLLVDRFSMAKVPQLPPTTTRLAWATAGQSFTLDGTLEPEGRNPLTLNGSTGFFPEKWTENPQSILDEAFNLQVNAPNIQLAPFADLSPAIKSLEGNIALRVSGDGTFRTPNLTGNLELDLPKARFNIDRLRRVRQTKLTASFADNQIRITPFSTSIDGGLFDLSGTVGIADTSDPTFDLRLTADKALVWRDDNINSRVDANIFLKGSLQQARLSGELGIVESLFYKDIELLPLNVPVSVPKAPKLPSLAKKAAPSGEKKAIPIPAPFDRWTLDLKARTADPFLVRGNLTTGEVKGALTATGELANPVLEGELTITDLDAALPFSTLSIRGGKAVFAPGKGFIPTLDIRAQSRIPPYEVDLFVAGSATSPSISFSSNPPLPENEVITLLATGTTTSGLEDPDAAKGKAFQLLVEQVRRAPPGSPLHPLARFAEPLKDVELQVAGADPFTGKRRNSVTLPVPQSERWFVTASVDSESNTRGLVLYILKFR